MFPKFHNFFESITPSEKLPFSNGTAVMLDAGHDMVETLWNYAIFYPKDRKSIKIFKWFFPSVIAPAEEVELTKENDSFVIAKELSKLLDNRDLVPVMIVTN